MTVIIITTTTTTTKLEENVNFEHSVIKMERIIRFKKDVWQKQNVYV